MESLSHVVIATVQLLQLLRLIGYSIFIYSKASQMPVSILGCMQIPTVWCLRQRAEYHLPEQCCHLNRRGVLTSCPLQMLTEHGLWLTSAILQSRLAVGCWEVKCCTVHLPETWKQWGTWNYGGQAQGHGWPRARIWEEKMSLQLTSRK